MIHTQSFYIAGIHDQAKAQTNAFGAMIMFAITFIASVAGITYDSMYKKEPLDGDEAEYHLTNDNIQSYGTSS